MRRVTESTTIGYLGPPGTFTEEALLGQADLARAKRVPFPSFWDVLGAVGNGMTDVGLVALENSIEGSVNVTLDPLIFSHELWIVREIQLSVAQSLVGVAGTRLDQVKKVVSMPVATAQCRTWLSQHLPGIEQEASPSTSEAVWKVAEQMGPQVVAIGTKHAAELYGLARPEWGIPAPTGHDKTTIVCFQSSDHPGSLHMILGQFAARNLNLTKLESRPTKKALGEYCFVIDIEGHVADEVVSDCLRDLHATLPEIKFLGSYPAAGEDGERLRQAATEAWCAADNWVQDLRKHLHD